MSCKEFYIIQKYLISYKYVIKIHLLVSSWFEKASALRTSYSQPALVKRADDLWGFLARRIPETSSYTHAGRLLNARVLKVGTVYHLFSFF